MTRRASVLALPVPSFPGRVARSATPRLMGIIDKMRHEARRRVRQVIGAAKHIGLDYMNMVYPDTPQEHSARQLNPDIPEAMADVKRVIDVQRVKPARIYDAWNKDEINDPNVLLGAAGRMAELNRKETYAEHLLRKAVNHVSRTVDYAKLNRVTDEIKQKLIPSALFSMVSGYVRQYPLHSLAIAGTGLAVAKGIKYVHAYLRKRKTKDDNLRAAPIPKQWRQSWKKARKQQQESVAENSATAFGAVMRGDISMPVDRMRAKIAKRLKRVHVNVLAREALPRGWVKPDHKYIRRITTMDGKYKYVYWNKVPIAARAKTKDALVDKVIRAVNPQFVGEGQVNINQRGGAQRIGINDDGIVVIGAPNLLGRKYIPNRKYVPPSERKGKPKRGTAYMGVIAGYRTDEGRETPSAYVYPVECQKDILAREAAMFNQIDEKLRNVHSWADRNIHGRDAETRELALMVYLLKNTHMRIGGNEGKSVPKEIISELQRQKKLYNWSDARYYDELAPYYEDTVGLLDLRKEHVAVAMSGNTGIVTLRFTAKACHAQSVRLKFDLKDRTQSAYFAELAKLAKQSRLFSITNKRVTTLYNTMAGVTPHKERHAFARRMFVQEVLSKWQINKRRYPTKTAAQKALKEAFYENISVPLGHDNKTHTISTALRSYVGADMKMAYEGLQDEINRAYVRRVSEAMAFSKDDWARALARLIIKADLAKQDILEDPEKDVVFV